MQFKDMMTLRKDPHNLLAVCIGIRIASRRPVSQKEREKTHTVGPQILHELQLQGYQDMDHVALPFSFSYRKDLPLSRKHTVLPRRAPPFCGVASEAKLFLFLAHEPSPSMACQCHEPDQNMLIQRVVRQNITAHDDPELGPRGSSVF